MIPSAPSSSPVFNVGCSMFNVTRLRRSGNRRIGHPEHDYEHDYEYDHLDHRAPITEYHPPGTVFVPPEVVGWLGR